MTAVPVTSRESAEIVPATPSLDPNRGREHGKEQPFLNSPKSPSDTTTTSLGHHNRSSSFSDYSSSVVKSSDSPSSLNRHNTLSSSRLARGERNRARIGVDIVVPGDQDVLVSSPRSELDHSGNAKDISSATSAHSTGSTGSTGATSRFEASFTQMGYDSSRAPLSTALSRTRGQDDLGVNKGDELKVEPLSSLHYLANSSYHDTGDRSSAPLLPVPFPSSSAATLSTGYYSDQTPRSPWTPTKEEVEGLYSPIGKGLTGKGLLDGSRSDGTSRETTKLDPIDNLAEIFKGAAVSTVPSTFAASRRLPPLMTNPDALAGLSRSASTSHTKKSQPSASRSLQGPASASPFVHPIGYSHLTTTITLAPIVEPQRQSSAGSISTDWTSSKERVIGRNELRSETVGYGNGTGIYQQCQMPNQSQASPANQEKDCLISSHPSMPISSFNHATQPSYQYQPHEQGSSISSQTPPSSSTLVPQSISHYNSSTFDARPRGARFFVIKSYTEEDVQKSLTHEIWSSTKLGNNRLDRAFRETPDPIYLFFSVNASGNFCGVAQMLSSVDYTTSSTVWASDKWKGIFSVKWIYVKDVPLSSLRHIILPNTPEKKSVASSRDTQEVPYVEGCEVFQILAGYASRTSLLSPRSFPSNYNAINK